MDKLLVVAYRYLHNAYVKNTEIELKMTEYRKILSKRLYPLSYNDLFFKRCLVLD